MVVGGSDWYPGRLADQAAVFTNVEGKIAGYLLELPLTQGQVDEILAICAEFLAVYNYVNASRATTESLGAWRDNAYNGQPLGSNLPKAPEYDAFTAGVGWKIGIVPRFRELVDLIKASPGYTLAIGEDLMIVAVKSDPVAPGLVTPDLKVSTEDGYKVNIAGSLQGTDAIRIEYQAKGSNVWATVGFLTKLPGSVIITPATPGEPESGRIRGHFIKKNEPYGNLSPEYPVTLS